MKRSRREFIKHSIATGALCCLPFQNIAFNIFDNNRKFGVILGLLNEQLVEDYEDTLGLIADLGYEEVEFSGTYGASKFDFKNALISFGLKPVAGGTTITELQKEPSKYIDDALFFDRQYIICYWPWLDGGLDKKLDDFKEAANRLNKIGELVKNEGLKFALHNHDKEFVDVGNGELGYDVLLKETDPALVDMEIDLYWVKKGNADPLDYFEKYPGRFKICHVKDMDNTPDRSFEIVGKGIIDFQQIFNKSEQAGLQHFIVEQDNAPDPVRTVTDSIKYLKELNF